MTWHADGMFLRMRADDIFNLSLEPTARACMRKDVLPDYLVQNTTKTDKTDKNVRAVRCSVQTPRRNG